MIRKHIVISGTGRTGTTFLVELLTNLGLDTGVANDLVTPKNQLANAGFEFDIRRDDAPYVVKSPHFCDHAVEVLRREDIVIDHVFIPMRDLRAAAESRRHVTNLNESAVPIRRRIKRFIRGLVFGKKIRVFAGGLWDTVAKENQETVLLEKNYQLILALSDSEIPVTFLRYPKHARDCSYLFKKLKPILGSINYKDFERVYDRTVRPELIHSFSKQDR